MNAIAYQNIKSTIAFLAAIILMTGCGHNSNKPVVEDIQARAKADSVIDVVTTMKVKPTYFYVQIVSNGKVEATNIANLVFKRSGMVQRVFVKNGQHVQKGQAIALLEQTDLQGDIEKKEIDCELSEFQLKDILIGQGYSYDKQSEIPPKILRLALIKSGYLKDKKELEDYKKQLGETILKAPFAGVVANVKARAHSATGSEPVCQVIGQKDMEVQFPLVENEVRLIKLGDIVSVLTYDSSAKQLKGHVKSINPIVDDDGLVTVTASVENGTQLISGMSVRVLINKCEPQQLVVPKTAVVKRSGRDVIFTVENGKAAWHYVNIGLENLKEYTIADGIKAGMEVIISGSQNLADGNNVKIQK